MMKKILVVEDDLSALRFVEYTLEHEGYQVITASDGIVGLTLAQKEKPALIILDVMLPGLDGFEVCRRLRLDPATIPIPVLMLSAKARDVDRNTGLNEGADDYLTKPADPFEIVRRVENLLKQKAMVS